MPETTVEIRLGGGKLLRFLPLIPDLLKLADNEPSLDTPQGVEGRIDEVLAFVRKAAPLTDITIDDTAIAHLDANPELKGTLVSIAVYLLGLLGEQEERMATVDVEKFTTAGIDSGTIAAIIAIIGELLAFFRKWREGRTTPPTV